jgi:hypothetical protein
MTYAITAGAGALAGSALTALLLAARFTARAQEAGWRRDWPESTGVVPVPPVVVRRLARQADSAERRARRFELAVAALQELHRDVIGDLLDAVRSRDAQIRRLVAPRHRHRTPVPAYGVHR